MRIFEQSALISDAVWKVEKQNISFMHPRIVYACFERVQILAPIKLIWSGLYSCLKFDLTEKSAGQAMHNVYSDGELYVCRLHGESVGG